MINLQQQRQEAIDTYFTIRQRMLDNYLSLTQCLQLWTTDGEFVTRWQELAERSFHIGEAQPNPGRRGYGNTRAFSTSAS
jgi:hypothetical protein